jgi:hypothetical protein
MFGFSVSPVPTLVKEKRKNPRHERNSNRPCYLLDKLIADDYVGGSPEERISNGGGGSAVVCTKQPMWNGYGGGGNSNPSVTGAASAHWSASSGSAAVVARRDYRNPRGGGSWLTALKERLGWLFGDRALFGGPSTPSSSGHASDEDDDDRDSSIDGLLPKSPSTHSNSPGLAATSSMVAGSSKNRPAAGSRYSQSRVRQRGGRLPLATGAPLSTASSSASSQPQTKDVQNFPVANANSLTTGGVYAPSAHSNQYSNSTASLSVMDEGGAVSPAMTDNNNRVLHDKDFTLR